MSISKIAMIVFFACFAIVHFFSDGAIFGLVEAIAAAVAAIALATRN